MQIQTTEIQMQIETKTVVACFYQLIMRLKMPNIDLVSLVTAIKQHKQIENEKKEQKMKWKKKEFWTFLKTDECENWKNTKFKFLNFFNWIHKILSCLQQNFNVINMMIVAWSWKKHMW